MKQGKHYLNLALWIVLALIVAYFGYRIAGSLEQPLSTAVVTQYEAGAGVYTTGYVVRSEQVLSSGYDISVLSAAEGARVSSGGTVATGYLTDGAQQRQNRIKELRSQLKELEYAGKFSSGAAGQAALDAQIAGSLVDFSRYLLRRDMNSLDALTPELKGMVLRRSAEGEDAAAMDQQYAAIQKELDALQTQAASDTRSITAPASGYFSGVVDGYESVLTPEVLMQLHVQDYEQLQPEEPAENAIGKIILGDTWYYVTAIPASEASGVQEGDRVKVSFARDLYEAIEMKVERLGSSEAGYRMLVLSCDRYMQSVTLLRQQSADVRFSTYLGLRVPKESIRVDEQGRTGVFVLEGAVATWKTVNILHDNGESYVVELDKSSTANLWPGDALIVRAKDLYDGKVVMAQ